MRNGSYTTNSILSDVLVLIPVTGKVKERHHPLVNPPLPHNSHHKITMPPWSNSSSNWKSEDDAKLLSHVKQGIVDPSDRSIVTPHKEWPQKPYKSFAQLVCGKLEKINLAQNTEGAHRVRAQLHQQGKLLFCGVCFFWRLQAHSPFNFA